MIDVMQPCTTTESLHKQQQLMPKVIHLQCARLPVDVDSQLQPPPGSKQQWNSFVPTSAMTSDKVLKIFAIVERDLLRDIDNYLSTL
jgi:hypothetical protein